MDKISRSDLLISIGGYCFQLSSENYQYISLIRERYSSYLRDKDDPCINIMINTVDYKLSADYELPLINCDNDEFRVSWSGMSGYFNLKDMEGELDCNWNPLHPHTSLDTFLRVILSIILPFTGGFLVHATSLIRNDKGYCFPGRSGAGKTTIALNSPDSIILTDELSLVRRIKGKYYIYGTPFPGECGILGDNIKHVLDAVYFPVKDKQNYRKKLDKITALRMLLPNVVSYTPNIYEDLFQAAYDFINQVSAYELHFLPDESLWKCIL